MATSASAKNVDFSNVKDGGNFNKARVTAGDYQAKILKVEDAKTKGDGDFMYLFTIQLTQHSAYKYPYYCKLTENQLWKLRNLLIAAGMTVPKKRMKLDPNKIVGKIIGVTMEDAEYEGKAQSDVAAVFPAAELMDGGETIDADDDDDDDDVDDVEDVDDAEEEAEDEGDQFEAMDRTELKAYLKAQDPEFRAKKSQTDDELRDLARAAGDSDDDDDDEEEEPAKPAPKKKAATKKTSKKKSADVSDDELEELDIDDL